MQTSSTYNDMLSDVQKKDLRVVVKRLNLDSLPDHVKTGIAGGVKREPRNLFDSLGMGSESSSSVSCIKEETVDDSDADVMLLTDVEEGTKKACHQMVRKIGHHLKGLKSRINALEEDDTDLIQIYQALSNCLDELGYF